MIVIARKSIFSLGKAGNQSGVALLQVLLLSAMISILAIEFSKTARKQLVMADQLQDRVEAELASHSTIAEIIFAELSHKVTPMGLARSPLLPNYYGLKGKRYGFPLIVKEGTTVSIQDLNGLLPQMFPQHILWRKLLEQANIPEGDISRYLGVWEDIQDSDHASWLLGSQEPKRLAAGGRYLNGFAQNSKVMEWVFFDRPELAKSLMNISNIHAPYETSLLNSPENLLESILDPKIAGSFIRGRSEDITNAKSLLLMLPKEYSSPDMYDHDSNRLQINVEVSLGLASWSESRIVYFSAKSNPPFKVILKK